MALPATVVILISVPSFYGYITRMPVSLPALACLAGDPKYRPPDVSAARAAADPIIKNARVMSKAAMRRIGRAIRQRDQLTTVRALWHAAELAAQRDGSAGLRPVG